MSFRNFLDLRKKTQQQTQIIERVVFQKRSLKSDLFLALSVIFVASFIIWGVSKADDSILETPTIIPEIATVVEALTQTNEDTVPSILPEPTSASTNSGEIQSENNGSGLQTEDTNLDLLIREDDTINTPLILVPAEGSFAPSSVTTFTSSTTTATFSPLLFSDLTNTITKAVDNITDIFTASSTYVSSTTVPVITSEDTDTGKLVTISAENENPFFPLIDVLASTTIPKLYKVGEESKIKIKWKNENNQEMSFRATDTNNDSYLDLVEWTVPHLSTQLFEIIFISKAFQLGADQNIVADIYDTVKTKDGEYASLSDRQYVRVTFEKSLTNKNDITLFARSTDYGLSTTNSIEVYPVYEDEQGNLVEGAQITTFEDISEAKFYKVLLTGLQKTTDVFDLKVVSTNSIDIDYIVDPTPKAFVAERNGSMDDGATFGNTSPGTQGDDYPSAIDTVDLAGFDLTQGGISQIAGLTDSIGGGVLDLSSNLTVPAINGVPQIIDAELTTSSWSGIILTGGFSYSGGGNGLTIDNYGSVIIDGDVVNSGSGDGIRINVGGTLTDLTGTLTNTSSSYGIRNVGGTITNISGTINNTSSGAGILYDGGTITSLTGDVNASSGYAVIIYSGSINGGTYGGKISNYSGAYIYGGTFNNTVENEGTIYGGTFNGTVSGAGTINGGEFNGTVTANGTISSGGGYTISGSGLISGANVSIQSGYTLNLSQGLTISENILVNDSNYTITGASSCPSGKTLKTAVTYFSGNLSNYNMCVPACDAGQKFNFSQAMCTNFSGTVSWQGGAGGEWTETGNWDFGLPESGNNVDATGATLTLDVYTGYTLDMGSGIVSLATQGQGIYLNGTISSGTYNGNVTLNSGSPGGLITGGTFSGAIDMQGGCIQAGIFSGGTIAMNNGSANIGCNNGIPEITSAVTVNSGFLSGGIFNGQVDLNGGNSSLYGGTYNIGTVTANASSYVTGGQFNGNLYISSGANFTNQANIGQSGYLNIDSGANLSQLYITAGGTVENHFSTLSSGRFSGIFNNYGTIDMTGQTPPDFTDATVNNYGTITCQAGYVWSGNACAPITLFHWVGGNTNNGYSVGSWDNPANWEENYVPTSGSDVEIGSSATTNAVIPYGHTNDNSGGVTLGDLIISGASNTYGIDNYGIITDIFGTSTCSINRGNGCIDNYATIVDISGEFTYSGNSGVGIYNDDNMAVINNISGTFINSGNSTGIYLESETNLYNISGTFTNSGNSYGIKNDGVIVLISGIVNNSAGGYGIQNQDGSITEFSGTLNNSGGGYGIGNYALMGDFSGELNNSDNGTGIYNWGPITDISGTITNSGGGTGLYHGFSTISDISGILNNTSSGYGIDNYYTITDISGKITNSGSGYGVYNESGATVDLINGDIINISNGYGIYNNSTITDISGNIYNFLNGLNYGLETAFMANFINLPVADGKIWTNASSTDLGNWDNADNWLEGIPANKTTDNIILRADITLPSDITGDVYFAKDGINLEGVGYTVTGDIYGISGNDELGINDATKGFDISFSNLTTTGDITAGAGGVGNFNNGGDGGDIIITGANLDFSTTTITGGLGGAGSSYGTNRKLELTYEGLTTNDNTFFNDVGYLVINGTSYSNDTECSNNTYCAWNGVFNPIDFYYNNATGNGNWNDVNNWWNRADFTGDHPANPPAGYDRVYVNGEVLSGIDAAADTISFNGTSSNAINISVTHNIIFNGSSTNTGVLTITTGTSTFYGNDTWASVGGVGTIISGFIQRIFTESATSTHNFTTEGLKNNWFVKAVGNIVVNISGSVYNLADNIFQALSGAVFQSGANSAGQPTPTIIVTSPISGTNIKWAPSIDWGNADVCMYSYDGFVSTTSISCISGVANIPRPSANISKTLSLRGINQASGHDNISETSVTYTYDNTSPTWTSCGTDLLDEATRPYYYLADGAVTGDCNVRVNTILYGSSATTSGTGVLTGQVIASATTTTNGFNITLKNITVTGTTTATGGTTGKNGGNISVYNSTVGPLVTNGGVNASGTGGHAGTTTVATSTTGAITANGGNGTSAGGNGGAITVTNSDGILAGTLVQANGGNASTNCGTVGVGGDINITNSDNYTAESIDGTGTCSSAPTGGTRRTPVVTARPVVTTSNNSSPSASTNSGSRSFVRDTINQITLPVQNIKPINLTKLPTFGEDKKGSFSFKLPLQIFLFNSPNTSATDNLKKYPKLQKYISGTLGLNSEQKLVALYNKPLKLDANAGDVLGIFKVISPNGNALVTTLKVDKKGSLYQYIKINEKDNYQTLNISLALISKTAIEGKLSNTKYTFTNNKNNIVTTINIPQKNGIYNFTTSASPLPLVIEVTGQNNTTPNITSDTNKPSLWSRVKSWFGR